MGLERPAHSLNESHPAIRNGSLSLMDPCQYLTPRLGENRNHQQCMEHDHHGWMVCALFPNLNRNWGTMDLKMSPKTEALHGALRNLPRKQHAKSETQRRVQAVKLLHHLHNTHMPDVKTIWSTSKTPTLPPTAKAFMLTFCALHVPLSKSLAFLPTRAIASSRFEVGRQRTYA